MNSIKFSYNELKDTASSSVDLLKKASSKTKAVTALDFAMQVQPNWNFYLIYTAIRCAGLALQYAANPTQENRSMIWKKAQLYSSTKVAGLVVSQIALSLLGLTTPFSVGLILGWGGVLASMSAYAKHRGS